MRYLTIMTLLGAVAVGACDSDESDPTGPDGQAVFEVRVQEHTFHVAAEDQQAINALESRLESGEEGVILGELAEGDGGFNEPWSWHMVPGTIQVPDVATEVCDGTPAFVEQNLDYWLNTVGRYCPWSAEVVARVD